MDHDRSGMELNLLMMGEEDSPRVASVINQWWVSPAVDVGSSSSSIGVVRRQRASTDDGSRVVVTGALERWLSGGVVVASACLPVDGSSSMAAGLLNGDGGARNVLHFVVHGRTLPDAQGLNDKDNEEIVDDPSIPNHSSKMTRESHEESPPKLVDMSESDKLEKEKSKDFNSFHEEITCNVTLLKFEDLRQPIIDKLEDFDLDTQEDKQSIFIAIVGKVIANGLA
ncbi:hypothetical protein ACLOJK_005475 [Asimina triloba]